MEQMQQMLTVKEAAEVMQVSIQTIYQWINAGHIAAVKIGAIIRIPQDSMPKAVVLATEEGEKDALARLLAMVQDKPDASVLDELETQARDRDAIPERPDSDDAQVMQLHRPESRVR